MEQRSTEWFAARLGKVTASRISDVMAKLKNGNPAAVREGYLVQLGLERLTGAAEPSFCNAAMQWGIDTEAQAREAYSEAALCIVTETGFVDHPSIEMAGASPDGLIGDDGMVEIKCPTQATHWTTLETQEIDRKYILQMQFQMACAGRAWCDFVSFDPRFPREMQMFQRRVERDDELISEIEAEVAAFLEELDRRVATARERYLMKEAA